MSDDEFDDFSIDDAALVQIDSLEQTAGGPQKSVFPSRTVASGPSAWSASRKPPAGKAPAFQLRALPLHVSSSSESGGISAASAGVRPPVDTNTSVSRTMQGRSNSVFLNNQPNTTVSKKQTNDGRGLSSAGNAIQVLSDDDDDEFEVLCPPAAIRRSTTGGSNNPGAPAVSAAEAARVARANAIRGLTGGPNAATNWLTTAQGSRPTTMGSKSTTKQPNQKNVKVTEWDTEKPQTQVVQTHQIGRAHV